MRIAALMSTLALASCAPEPCTVADNGDGSYTLSCPDGTSATLTDGTNGEDAVPWLVATADEPAGANCPDGGLAITVGPDSDGDGSLSSSEGVSTTYVCDGADGVSYLVDVADEPAGVNCDNGGVKITVGADSDGDGTLAQSEITATEYVCDGANGADGADGADAVPVLVRIDDEPAGSNCAQGGLAVHTGDDDNLDGTLSDPEINDTSYVCNGEDGVDGVGGSGGAFAFPTSSSTLYNTSSTTTLGSGGGGVIYQTGSYVQGSISGTGVTSARGGIFVFLMDDQTSASCSVGDLDFTIKVNGTTVGTYTYTGGTRAGVIAFDEVEGFSAISGTGTGGDTYTIRYEAAETVCSGGGSYNWYPGGRVILF